MILDNPTLIVKTALIDKAIAKYGIRSIMDVGACWGVNGGYTFHALENGVENAIILDGNITTLTRERAKKYSDRVACLQMDLGDIAAVQDLPEVDAIILFDILLHQVRPDWDTFMAMYAEKANVIIVYNQNFIGERTIRFIDFGRDFYKKYRFFRDQKTIDDWFSKHNEIDPISNKQYRDIHNFWQFGITSTDIIQKANSLHFKLDFFENNGILTNELPFIEVHSFLFHKDNRNPLFI